MQLLFYKLLFSNTYREENYADDIFKQREGNSSEFIIKLSVRFLTWYPNLFFQNRSKHLLPYDIWKNKVY